VLITGADDHHLHISKTYWVLKKLWHNARPGCVARRVQTTDPGLKGYDPHEVQTVAFDSGDHLTVLFVNPTGSQKRLTVRGLRGLQADIYLTTATSDMAHQRPVPVRQGTAPLVLPARSIAVLVTSGGA
jgi:hypothetical protein